MKAKLKGLGGVKGLLLLHGEKILIGTVSIAAVALIYLALKAERLSDRYEPGKLQTQVQATRTNISSTDNNWSKVSREHPDQVRLADGSLPYVGRGALNVDNEVYTPIGVLNPDVIKRHKPRTDPVLLPAASAVAKGGAGLFSFIDEDARRQRELRKQREDAVRARKEANQQELDQSADGRGGRRSGGRGRRGNETRQNEDDPEHPGRRAVEGMTTGRGGGAQLEGGELVELAHWVIVTAKVPVKDQRSQYREAFDNPGGGGNFNAELDFPSYKGYRVQRVEVVGNQDMLPWQDVPVQDARGTPSRRIVGAAMAKGPLDKLAEYVATEWAVSGIEDPVDPNHLDPGGVLTYPLPPLLGRDWGADVTHPDIPLASSSLEDTLLGGTTTEAESTKPAAAANTDEFGDPNQGMGVGMGRGGRSERPSFADRRGGRGRGGRGDYVDRSATRDSGRGTRNLLPPGVNSWLLRFFDFTVVPGKKYKYRVQLVLDDPILAPHVKYTELDPKVAERVKNLPKGRDLRPTPASSYRSTDWSEPTPTVGVPLDGDVRMAGVQLTGDEPKAKLLVQAYGKDPKVGNWIQATPQNAEKDREFTRGSVVNFLDDAEFLVENGSFIDKADGFRFSTGITVLDMRGGERIGGRDMTAPSRVLLMDPTGQLIVRRELEDAADVQAHRDVFGRKRGADREQQPDAGRRRPAR